MPKPEAYCRATINPLFDFCCCAMFFRLLAVSLIVFLAGYLAPGVQADGSSRAVLENFSQRVYREVLPNGLTVLLYTRDIAPVFSGVLTVRVGGVDELIGESGLAHMLEHMAFKGTPSIGSSDYNTEAPLLAELETLARKDPELKNFSSADKKRWDEIHAQLEQLWRMSEFTRVYQVRGASGMNASTSSELTNYYVSLPKNAFSFWNWIESERLLRPVMRQFYKERDVVIEERRMRYEDSPSGYLYEQLLANAFQYHPYRRPVIGYPFELKRLRAEQAAAFHDKYYVPRNMVLAIVGDVHPEQDMPIIRKYFGQLRDRPAPRHPDVHEPDQEGERRFSVSFPASPELAIAYHKPQFPDPRDAALAVLFEVFAGSSTSPLYERLVKDLRIASGVGHFEAPGVAYSNLVVFGITPQAPHSNEQVLREFDAVLRRFITEGPSDEAIARAKRKLAKAYLLGMRSNSSLASSLASSEILFGGWQSVLDWYDQVMAVSKAEILERAKTYLIPTNRTIGFLERGEKQSRKKGQREKGQHEKEQREGEKK